MLSDRLRALRKDRNLSQGDVEKRTGLLRVYLSRVENGHTVPSLPTLEKLARALKVPLYRLFYDGKEPPKLENLPRRVSVDDLWPSGKEAQLLENLQDALGKMRERDRNLLMSLARKMVGKRRRKAVAA